ncbi:hypothetical protein IQ07DRAFT_650232 [Pyrenochaeta sp. DS3sAY3a]|nr:hypothetical protein IQ07DRAFT_650232 [Pyrenochaeta sp. DS3sAY3a]
MSQTLKLRGLAGDETEGRIMERLHDTQDELSAQVHTLELAPRTAQECSQLLGTLELLDNLQVLVWETHLPMPTSLLSALHTRPQIQLHVVNIERHDLVMQHELLSSPSLHTLDITVLGQILGWSKTSEFRVLKSLLQHAQGLKSLTLRITGWHGDIRSPPPDFEEGKLNLQFEPGDEFPALEELTLDCYNWYHLDTAHCEMWANCMDWSCLRRLDLGHATPQYLLPAITGRVPQITNLRFGFWPNPYGPKSIWSSPEDLGVVERFVESVDALESVTFFTWTDKECSQIRPALLAKHGRSLKKLRHELDFRDAWKPEHLEDLRDMAPGLEDLSVTIEMEQLSAYPNARSCWPMSVQRIVSSMASLRHVTLRIHLKRDSYQFVPPFEYIPGQGLRDQCCIDDVFARSTVASFFKDFGADSAIETVRVRFWSVTPNEVLWTYTARNKWQRWEEKYAVVVKRDVKGEERNRQLRALPLDPFG